MCREVYKINYSARVGVKCNLREHVTSLLFNQLEWQKQRVGTRVLLIYPSWEHEQALISFTQPWIRTRLVYLFEYISYFSHLDLDLFPPSSFQYYKSTMASDKLTPGMLKYVWDNYLSGKSFEYPELRLQIVFVRQIEKPSANGMTRFRVYLTDGENAMHTIMFGQEISVNRMITSSSYRLKITQNKPIILLENFEAGEFLEPIKSDNPCLAPIVLPEGTVDPGPASATNSTSAAPAPAPAAVKSEPVSAAAPAPAAQNNSYASSASSGLPIVKQDLGGQASKPKTTTRSKKFTAIRDVSPYNSKWTIQARVADKSDIIKYSKKTTGQLFNVTFIDDSGVIRATGFNEQCDKFFSVLEVGKVYYVAGARVNTANKQFSKVDNDYELSLDRNTQIQVCHEAADEIPVSNYKFIPLDQISDAAPNSIADVLGVLSHVEDVSQITTKKGDPFSKRDITLVDDTGYSIRCTVWGRQAEQFNVPLGNVIAVKGAKVNDYGGRSLSLFSSSTLVDEPQIPESFAMKGWYVSRGSAQSFQSLVGPASAPTIGAKEKRLTIQTVKLENLGMSEKPDVFVLKATVSAMRTNSSLYYPACPDCMKKVVVFDTPRCEKCNKDVPEPVMRYTLSVCVSDETDQIWVSCFEETGAQIIGISGNELAKYQNEDVSVFDHYTTKFPRIEYLFKIRAKQDIYQDNIRVRYSVMTIAPLNYAEEGLRLLEELEGSA